MPKANYSGDFNISFKVTDGNGSTVSSTAKVTVAAVADDTNITITNAVDPATTNIVFASDNFESGDDGWNATTSYSANLGTGDMLGRCIFLPVNEDRKNLVIPGAYFMECET
jgi:hypothetical protein